MPNLFLTFERADKGGHMRLVLGLLVVAGCGSSGKVVGEERPVCSPVAWSGEMPAEAASRMYEGKLWEAEGTNEAAGTTEGFFVLALTAPVCGRDGRAVTEVQVYSPDPEVRASIVQAIEQNVRITGPGCEEHTAHHHRPIVVEATSVEKI